MRVFALSAAALCALPLFAQPLPRSEAVDTKAIEILRKHGLDQSQVMEHLSWICDVYGPRLTGSINLRNAQRWAVEKFQSMGLTARTESWGPFGRGWQCRHVCVEVIGDNPWPILAYPKAWSPSLAGRVEAEVVLAGNLDADQLAAMDLTGKIVFVDAPRAVQEPFDGTSKRFDATDLLSMADQTRAARAPVNASASGNPGTPPADFRAGFAKRQAMMRLLAKKKPLAMFDRASKGDYGTVFVQGASASQVADASGGRAPSARDADAEVIPQFTIAVEHYNRICRLIEKRIPVRIALELETRFESTDSMENNVIAEIPGGDAQLGAQLVMIGAHFDSWQAGTGCTDNGCGSAVVMEAMRLLQELCKETGVQPRRTIRAALWSGEEQGLLGSNAYARQQFGERNSDRGWALKEAHGLLSGYYNLDNGTGRIRGVYLQGNEAVAPIFRAWLRPFHDLGATTLTLNDTGGTDHLAFDRIGLPGFQFIQDPVSYDSRTHHSNMDVWDHAVPEDLRQAATIMAAFAWHTAQRDEILPRKPMPSGEETGRRGNR